MPRTTVLTTLTLAAVVLSTAVLSGCAATPTASGLSLLDTKSPVQLLRNEAADRIEPAVLDVVRKSSDASVPCVTDDGNEGGLIRQWKSSSDLALVAGADAALAAEGIVRSFTEQGWTAETVDTNSVEYTELASDDSIAVIQVAAADESTSSLVRITTTGPCVSTGGPDSDEVTSLE